MKEVTVNKLIDILIKEQQKGNGDKVILISNDDEGNGFHTLFYGITSKKEDIQSYYDAGMFHDDNDPDTVVLLG